MEKLITFLSIILLIGCSKDDSSTPTEQVITEQFINGGEKLKHHSWLLLQMTI